MHVHHCIHWGRHSRAAVVRGDDGLLEHLVQLLQWPPDRCCAVLLYAAVGHVDHERRHADQLRNPFLGRDRVAGLWRDFGLHGDQQPRWFRHLDCLERLPGRQPFRKRQTGAGHVCS